jgi:predicted metal-dependent HD superfamily phosphohydrolase
MLQQCFLQLLSGYTGDAHQADQLWKEVTTHYSEAHRHYHTLAHLEHLYQQLHTCKHLFKDWDTALFALFYHDIIYNPQRSDNEEKSAELAVKRLQSLSYSIHKAANCYALILATKSHQYSKDVDTNLFTDADLSILGSSWDIYSVYATNIRKEYAVYPDALYKSGRAKVLQHFLQMERIFETAYFHERFEAKARENLQAELQQLS